jgi:hypothetical protein
MKVCVLSANQSKNQSFTMKTNIYFLVIITCFFISCNKSKESAFTTVSVDVDSSKPIDVEDGNLINLETCDSSLLYEVNNILFLKEKYFIFSRNKIVVFNNNGKYLFNLSRKGQGPAEYSHISSVFVRDNEIYIFDSMQKKLLCFDDTGQFIKSINLPATQYPIGDIQPLPDNNYIAKNMFQGEAGITPLCTVLAEDFSEKNIVKGLFVNTGFSVNDDFAISPDNILYIEPLSDTICSINNLQTVEPKYVIDFGKYAIPQSERKDKDVYDLIQYTNRPDMADKIACLAGMAYEDEQWLRFRFLFNCICYVYYDKQNKISNVFKFTDKTGKYKPSAYVKYYNGKIYLVVQPEFDFEQNPSIVIFDEKLFTDKLK